MTAVELITCCAQHGISLVGRTVLTEALGDYCGGPAVVTELTPEEGPILFVVENPDYNDGEGGHSIGVFDFETVTLLPKEAK